MISSVTCRKRENTPEGKLESNLKHFTKVAEMSEQRINPDL